MLSSLNEKGDNENIFQEVLITSSSNDSQSPSGDSLHLRVPTKRLSSIVKFVKHDLCEINKYEVALNKDIVSLHDRFPENCSVFEILNILVTSIPNISGPPTCGKNYPKSLSESNEPLYQI